MHPIARRQRLEMFIGILGVFTVMAFISAVIVEVKGEPALRPVLVVLLFGIPLLMVIRAWRRY
ncbi:MAG: hypothetical protein H0V07_06315 [Propionibacteriales bacterium]|nr:hypothetical protein [Propionibacteriales bacterium]